MLYSTCKNGGRTAEPRGSIFARGGAARALKGDGGEEAATLLIVAKSVKIALTSWA
jgi:hypothetical protein